MYEAELIQANIENLISFWTACGTTKHPLLSGRSLHSSVSWPWRMWFDYDYQATRQDFEQLLIKTKMMDKPVLIPQWHEKDTTMNEFLGNAGFEVSMRQRVMAASLGAMKSLPKPTITLHQIDDLNSINQWTQAASASFNFYVHEPIIARLTNTPNFHLLLAQVDGTAVGTGMLLQTQQVAGIFLVGVHPDHRRKGYATQVMLGLLEIAQELNCEYATLQASPAGEPLYEKLGFIAQSLIQSYRKKKP